MDNKEHIISEIKKYKRLKNEAYANLISVPATLVPSIAALIGGIYAAGSGSNENIAVLTLLCGGIASYYSFRHADNVICHYDNKTVKRYDDFEFEEPALKDQIKEAKDNLILLQAQLIQEERENRNGR